MLDILVTDKNLDTKISEKIEKLGVKLIKV